MSNPKDGSDAKILFDAVSYIKSLESFASDAPIKWHFVGGRCQAVACLQCVLQETTGWSDELAMQHALKMFDKIQARTRA